MDFGSAVCGSLKNFANFEKSKYDGRAEGIMRFSNASHIEVCSW